MNQDLRQQAQSLLQKNNLSGARKVFQQICNQDAQDAESWYMLSALSARIGDFNNAEKAFRHTIKLIPDNVELQDGLGGVLQELGKPQQAIKHHRHAIKLNPSYPYAHYNLGNAYRKLNQQNKAAASYRNTIKLEPGFTDAHNNLGNVLRHQDKFKEAEVSYKTALKLDPQAISTLLNLGQILQTQGKNDEAMPYLTKVLAREEENIEANLSAAAIQCERGLYDKAILHLQKVISREPKTTKAHGTLGNVLVSAGRFDEAVATFENLLELDPESIDAEACICTVLEKQGKYEESFDRLQPLLAKSHNNVNAAIIYGFLANHFGKSDDAIKRMRRALSTPGLIAGEQERLHFGLGRLQDKAGRYKEAFKHYRKGNEARTVSYDAEKTHQQFERLKQIFSKDYISNMQKVSVADNEKKPIFIIGMPRSGTSLVEQIIASHPDVFGAGELNTMQQITESLPMMLDSSLSFPDCIESADQSIFEAMSQQYLDTIKQLSSGETYVIDKLPHNFLYLGLIVQLFPNAKIIHCKREPADTCLSCYFNTFGDRHAFSNDLANLGQYYNYYRRLMKHWHDTLGTKIFEIQYEELVTDQEAKSKALLDFCGIDWNEQCLNFHDNKRIVSTASYNQVRQPMYQSSVKRWMNYEKFISPLLSNLDKIKEGGDI